MRDLNSRWNWFVSKLATCELGGNGSVDVKGDCGETGEALDSQNGSLVDGGPQWCTHVVVSHVRLVSKVGWTTDLDLGDLALCGTSKGAL